MAAVLVIGFTTGAAPIHTRAFRNSLRKKQNTIASSIDASLLSVPAAPLSENPADQQQFQNRYTKRTGPAARKREIYPEDDLDSLLDDFLPPLQFTEIPTRLLSSDASPLELHWSDPNYDSKICRVHHACISGTQVYVPKWMSGKLDYLHACGLYNVHFYNATTSWIADAKYLHVDLFGSVPKRYHIPHFLTDVLPMIFSADIIRPTKNIAGLRTICENNGKRCDPQRMKETLKAALWGEDRILDMKLASWVPHLIAMLPHKPTLITSRRLEQQTTCLRSMIAYPGTYVKVGQWYTDTFETFGITRKSVISDRQTSGCELTVRILNREGWVDRSGILAGRDLVNIDDVVNDLSRRAHHSGLRLSIHVDYFENKTFFEQVDIMQTADIILGVHGAGLGNLIFARRDVGLIEVMPFAYYAGPFDMVARALGISYDRVIAKPDTINFLRCLEMRAKRVNDMTLLEEGRRMWIDGVSRYKRGSALFAVHKFTGERNSNMKICSRGQRMTVNVAEVVDKVLQRARGVCGKFR